MSTLLFSFQFHWKDTDSFNQSVKWWVLLLLWQRMGLFVSVVEEMAIIQNHEFFIFFPLDQMIEWYIRLLLWQKMGLWISMVMAKAIIQNEEFFFQRKWIWEELRVWMLSKHILRILKFSTNIKRTEEKLFSLDTVQNAFVHFIDLILLCINGKKNLFLVWSNHREIRKASSTVVLFSHSDHL